jgi:hypothetical protein
VPDGRFGFVQFEFAFPLGPADGRYLRRRPGGGEPERIVALRTLGATERRRFRGRRPQAASEEAEPEPVPTVRATLIEAEPLQDPEGWLANLRSDAKARDAYTERGLRELNAVLRAHRAAAADPYAREVSRGHANVVRVGYGSGEKVAEGRYDAAYEVRAEAARRRPRVEGLAPQERLAAVLSGSDSVLVSEELVLRARIDLDAGRPREAALQARIALEALLAELPDASELASHREAVAAAANAALEGDVDGEAVEEAVKAMRSAIARRARRAI